MLSAAALLLAFGMIRLHTNPIVFREWIAEDGLIEWVTFAGLVALAFFAWVRAHAFGDAGSDAGRHGRAVWVAIGVLGLFFALEEISWGQRVFGWESPDWFLRHNAQQETNLHNLVAGEVKINKLVFGQGLGLAAAIYLLVLPLLYRHWTAARAFLAARAVPMAQNYQIALTLTAAVFYQASVETEGKAGELQELALVFIFLAVLLHPFNASAMPAMPWRRAFRVALNGALAAAWQVLRRWVPARIRFLAMAAALLVTVFMLFRMIFTAAFEPAGLIGPAGELVWEKGIPKLLNPGPGLAPAGDVAWAWWLGFKYDLRIALLLLLPVALLSWMKPLDLLRRRRWWLGYLVLAGAAAFILQAVDLGHYAYQASRLDATVLDHVAETGIAARMIWESYPVVPVLAGLGTLTALYLFALRRWMPVTAEPIPSGAKDRRLRRAVTAAAIVLYLFGIYGKWSWYPLRWSDAYFSPNDYVSALALNPLQNIYDTLHVRNAGFDAEAARRAYPIVAAQLGLSPQAPASLSFARTVQPPPSLLGRPNVIVVFLESFSAYKTGVLGNPLDPTPNFDALARNSVLFSRFYVAARPTARAVFSSLFGIPDVNPGLSASRNPLASRQHTIVNAFEGYEKYYFIGGSASWGNIRAMLGRNIPSLHLYEEGSYAAPRNDVWGISDLHLLEEAHGVLRGRRQPFIAFIQTSGGHRPYTIPSDRRGFELKPMDPAVLRRAGFDDPRAYDSIRFMDHAVGHFFQLARAESYFRNTLFVLYGDHGSYAARFPEVEQELRHMHVPLVIHAPALFPEGRVIADIASSIDVLPTVAALAGVSYRNTTLGRDLLATRTGAPPFVFMSAGQFMGLLDGEFFLSACLEDASSLHHHHLNGSADPENLSERYPGRMARMEELCRALHDTSRWLLYNNTP